MAHTNNWDETTPTNTTNAVDIDDHIRKLRLDIRERMAIDHNLSSSDDGSDAYGIHDKVTFKDQIASPSLSSNQKVIYPKTADYECELRYKDKRGIDGYLFFIGEVRMRLGTTVPTGWLALNGNSIGQTGSGADLTGSNYEDLYKFLWGELDNTAFPVAGGRGGSADADWAALKKGTMPDARSRSPICAGQGSGLANRVIGYTGGNETHALSIAELAAHTHGVGTYTVGSGGAHTHDIGKSTSASSGTYVSSSAEQVGTLPTNSGGSHSHGLSGASASVGSGTAHNNMHPFIVLSMIIRY